MPIERVNLTTYSPDSLTNNPAILTDGSDVEVVDAEGNVVTRNLGTYNVYPTIRGFKSLIDPTEMFPAPDATNRILGAYVASYLDDSTKLFAGTATDLYLGQLTPNSGSGSWTEVNRTSDGGAYSNPGVEGRWHFAQLGDITIAVSSGNLPQNWDDATTKFINVEGIPPKAKYVAVANNFVILANLDGATTPSSNQNVSVWVSGFGKYDYWTTGDQNLSEYFALLDTPGEITGIHTIGRSVYVYKLRATHMLSFSTGWSNDLVSTQAGAVSHDAVVDLGERHVSMGYDNFYEFQSGGGAASLPNPLYEKIFGTHGDLDRTRLGLVQGRFDRVRNVVFWHYPSVGRRPSTAGDYCDRWVAWSVDTERWAIGEATTTAVVYPNFDTNTGVTYADFGSITAFQGLTGGGALTWGSSLMNPGEATTTSPGTNTLKYTGGSIVGTAGYVSGYASAVVDAAGALTPAGVVAYAPKTTTLSTPVWPYRGGLVQTGDFGDGVVYKFLRGIRPRFVEVDLANSVDGPAARLWNDLGDDPDNHTSLTVLGRNDLDQLWTVISSGTMGSRDASRWFSLRGNARYFKFLFEFTGGQELSGFDIDYDEAGPR